MAELKSVNPFTGQVLETFPEWSPEQVDAAIARAEATYREWRTVPFAERAQLLRRAAELFRERRDELARTMSLEMGKLLRDALPEVELCAQIFAYYAEHGEALLAAQHLSTADGEGTLHQLRGLDEPAGIGRRAQEHVLAAESRN